MKLEAASPIRPGASGQGRRRAVNIIVALLAAAAFFALPLWVLSHGYLPNDDALRHAAKAVSGKPWQEILLLRPEITIDHNPGWHWLLGALHRAAGWDARTLVQVPVVAMFVLFACAPLPWMRRAEAWLAALAVMLLVFPYLADRAFLGRPLFITMAVTLVLLCVWTTRAAGSPVRGRLAATVALTALSTWIHGSWYLLVLLPAAFLLARQWRNAAWLGAGWAAGSVLGAVLTGEPWTFLRQSALIPLLALGQDAPPEALVGEFQPLRHGYSVLLLAGAVLFWRQRTGRSLAVIGRDPVFWLMVLGFVLGYRVVRFWLDWGVPALTLWLARQTEEFLEERMSADSWLRPGAALAAALLLVLGLGPDRGARWSQYAKMDCLDASRPDHAGWIPGPGGVLYAVDMSVFYQTFFTNPRADWRYAMGFEPTFMQAENLAVYHELCRTRNAITACAPWVRRMTSEDRLVLRGGLQIRPEIPQLEWFYAAENTWVGRLPPRSR